MRGYLLDTHIWFWYLIGSYSVPKNIIDIINSNKPSCWYSPISIWELSVLNRKNRIQIKGNLRDWISESLRLLPLNEAPFNKEIAITAGEMRIKQADPADYFIASTARVYDLTLLTIDMRLTELEWLKTISE